MITLRAAYGKLASSALLPSMPSSGRILNLTSTNWLAARWAGNMSLFSPEKNSMSRCQDCQLHILKCSIFLGCLYFPQSSSSSYSSNIKLSQKKFKTQMSQFIQKFIYWLWNWPQSTKMVRETLSYVCLLKYWNWLWWCMIPKMLIWIKIELMQVFPKNVKLNSMKNAFNNKLQEVEMTRTKLNLKNWK